MAGDRRRAEGEVEAVAARDRERAVVEGERAEREHAVGAGGEAVDADGRIGGDAELLLKVVAASLRRSSVPPASVISVLVLPRALASLSCRVPGVCIGVRAAEEAGVRGAEGERAAAGLDQLAGGVARGEVARGADLGEASGWR